MQSAIRAYVGLGSNLGNPQESVRTAIFALSALAATEVRDQSSLYLTAPIDADGEDYVNAVVALDTHLTSTELLLALQHIEAQFGRVRTYQNAPRTLDCDLLLFGDEILNSPFLTLPHPRMHQRAFVLIPLLEISPKIFIPAVAAAQSLLNGLGYQSIKKLS